jgi:zinc/manganese transport system ATP-binding protein
MTAPLLAVNGLTKQFGGFTALADISLHVMSGERLGLIGPNGSGKTTLVRLILGQLSPASGSLQVLGHAPRRGDATIGYVPQRSEFDPELSIRGHDFVQLGLDGHRWGIPLFGAGRNGKAGKVDDAIAAVGASGYAAKSIGRLSGGEQQRLLLAQALVGDPRLLLMDEPLSYLDVRNQGTIVQLIADLARRRHLTVMLIAHDVNPLLRHIDNVVYVAAGRVAMGRPEDIITSKRLSEIYNTPVEVMTDSRGRVFVVGLEEEVAHPHA